MSARPGTRRQLPRIPAPALDTPCRGRADEWQWSALTGRRWIEQRAQAAVLCHGCPLLGRPCAQRALDEDHLGEMVWSGIPVPPPHHDDYRRAVSALQELAGHE
ncbi:hypothetical protein [Rhodococcus sp. LW-XY12]|uniref:hypothetical protein n=1 Tax=Rhodococcus sp. LW-XY12 TaxID=2856851 RepID=UPI001C581A84|nr:hypothetical protein [Rhodococcus sp. LW-XY12]QXU55210.1 hypothetical protein KXC42_08295 [Rhodococcus sp. LW-XY12]